MKSLTHDQKGLAVMQTAEGIADVAPEMNLRNAFHADKKAHKQVIYAGFEAQGRRLPEMVSVALQKELMSSKNSLLQFCKCKIWRVSSDVSERWSSDTSGSTDDSVESRWDTIA